MSNSFPKVHKFVNKVQVVNDTAEREVKLKMDYAAIICNDSKQIAMLLQVVEQHRRAMPDFLKSTLARCIE